MFNNTTSGFWTQLRSFLEMTSHTVEVSMEDKTWIVYTLYSKSEQYCLFPLFLSSHGWINWDFRMTEVTNKVVRSHKSRFILYKLSGYDMTYDTKHYKLFKTLNYDDYMKDYIL